MKNQKPILLFLLMFVLCAGACSFEPDMDRGKFKEVRAAQR
jgi:hypothetical protein